MKADITNKAADSAYKLELTRWEPWKVIAVAVSSAAAFFGVLGGVLGFMLGHFR